MVYLSRQLISIQIQLLSALSKPMKSVDLVIVSKIESEATNYLAINDYIF